MKGDIKMNLQKISEEKFEELLKLHYELCVIPAPSHFEDKRAEYVLKYLKAAGVVSGMEDGSFKPGMGATRAQAACMIYRAMELAGNIKGGE